MVSIPTVASALAAMKTIKDLAESMVTLRDTAMLNEKRIEFQGVIIDARENILAIQDERATLLKTVDDLEKKIVSMETWDTEKQRYELKKSADGGALAYAIKPAMENGDAPHKICATCYQHRIKSILQTEMRNPGFAIVLVCNTCGSDIYESGSRHQDHPKPMPRRKS